MQSTNSEYGSPYLVECHVTFTNVSGILGYLSSAEYEEDVLKKVGDQTALVSIDLHCTNKTTHISKYFLLCST